MGDNVFFQWRKGGSRDVLWELRAWGGWWTREGQEEGKPIEQVELVDFKEQWYFLSGIIVFSIIISFFCLFVCFFLAAPWHMKFPGQGSDLSHSCHLSHSCSHAGSLSHCVGLGIEPASQGSQDAASPTVPQWELCNFLSIFKPSTNCLKCSSRYLLHF